MNETLPKISGVILLRDDGAALLQHRDDRPGLAHAGMWVPPGGHCEAGESDEACARREFEEETNYCCADLHLLTAFRLDHVEHSPPIWLTIFWARYDGHQALVCGEGQAVAFVLRDAAPGYPIPDYLLDAWDLALDACRVGVR